MHGKRLAGLAVVAVLALGGTAAAGVAEREPAAAASGPPAISVIGWDPARGATTVWRGLAVLRQTRELPGARVPALARSIGTVAFVRHVPAGFEVRVTGTQNDTERRLARVAGQRPSSLAVSPDGRVVAFPSSRGLETVTTLGVRRLLPTPGAWRGSFFDGLQFSPDGSRLAFSRTWRDARTGALRNELGVIRRDGGGARSLVPNPRPAEGRYRPAFTLDGRRLVFTAAGGALASVPVAGGAATSLTAPSAKLGERIDTDPVFSRDGAWVAFTRWRSAAGGGGSDVYVMRLSGAELRRVTTTPASADRGAPGIGSAALAWSPDGTRLLARRYDGLAVVDVASGASTELVRLGYGYLVGGAYWNP